MKKQMFAMTIGLLFVPPMAQAQQPQPVQARPQVQQPRPGGPAIQPTRPGGPQIQPPRPGGGGSVQPPRPDRPRPPTDHRPGYQRPPHHQIKPIRGKKYHYPRGYHYQRWTIGLLLPAVFLSSTYYYDSYSHFGLGRPPQGYRWVRYGPDLILVNVRTRKIRDVIYRAFY
jgi:Ni/Co efflux regulator RcnB